MKNLLRNIAIALSLFGIGAVSADAQTVRVRPLSLSEIGSNDQGGVSTTAKAVYNNTQQVGFFLPALSAPYPPEIADDIPFSGSHHVNGFTFAYFCPTLGTIDAAVHFYDSIDVDDTPMYPFTAEFILYNLPADPEKLFIVDVDLRGSEGDQSFDFSASTFSDGSTGGYMSLLYSRKEAGTLLGKGNSPMSRDSVYLFDSLSGVQGPGFFNLGGGDWPNTSFYAAIYED